MEQQTLTPLMKQYFDIKNKFSDSILLFQVGDFYEMFCDDAKKAAASLSITLTKRGNINGEPIPLCGIPVHALDNYLSKLIKCGYKVAICDQLEEAVPGKVVRRGVRQVLTPATLTDTKLLNEKSASYLFSFFPAGDNWGILFGELLTAQLFATLIPANAYKILESELVRFFPDEILIPNNKNSKQLETYFKQLGYFTTISDAQAQENIEEQFQEWIQNQFNADSLKNITEFSSLRAAILNFYSYLKVNQESSLNQFKNVNFYKTDDFLVLDSATQKNLELVRNNYDNTIANTLFEHLDKASTAMGSRMIKKWIVRPLMKHELIVQRQDAVEALVKNVMVKDKLVELLTQVMDLERVVGRIALRRAHLNDYLALSNAISKVPEIKRALEPFKSIKYPNRLDLFINIESKLIDFGSLNNLLNAALNEDFSKSWLIKSGFDANLDNCRELVENANKKILDLERKEIQETKINSLKISYNQVHGYYIEITKTNLHLVPAHYIRHQTLAGKERYLTQDLQQLQIEIESAHKEIKFIESAVFEKVKEEVNNYITDLRRTANSLATLDTIISFAQVAYHNGYSRPRFSDSQSIIIEDGRHPIIESVIGNKFIANSTNLTNEESLWIITGPNMGGKSTYLRQVALISILAQCGSFVPAKSAHLPILDRIFTRIGAGDNLAEGKSTFLVEMEETAIICNQSTERSLVILDEVGRGTSTFDGLSIAQAVIEYIYKNIKARCLFATHYHELTNLQNQFPGIASYYMASNKTENGIMFLHKLIKGIADGSYGIEVAKLAQLPDELIIRAAEILEDLNSGKQNNCIDVDTNNILKKLNARLLEVEKKLLQNEKVLAKLSSTNFDELSPKKAFDILWEIKELI
ncbi:MAG: DNA mismatch repair protein MutS [Candidatus Babeliales bacterium]|nr:DNA mismatch repair protein MutS [Candidatus Babeliales bacterium]